MALKPCAECGQAFQEDKLFFHDKGQICADCEALLNEQAEQSAAIWRTIVAPFALGVSGSLGVLASCVPYVGLFASLIGFFLGAATVLAGGRAIQLQGALDAEALLGQEKALLWMGGIAGLLWGVGILGMSFFSGLASMYAMFSTSYYY